MKTLLALVLVAMMAGVAAAQTQYLYEPCEYQLGLFFSTNAADRNFVEEATNIDYTQFSTFYMHLVIMNAPDLVSAYELQISGVPDGAFIPTWVMVPNAGWLNLGDTFLHIATFGFPQPNAGGYIYLGHWSMFALQADVAAQITIQASTPSSIQNDGPALVVNAQLVRSNFTPAAYSGCDGTPVPPGDFPPYVATTYGDGVTAIENHSLTNVKSLFR
jgi:hypothetical protein